MYEYVIAILNFFLPILLETVVGPVWWETLDECPELWLEAVGEVVDDGHLRKRGDVDAFLYQVNIVWNLVKMIQE